MRELSFLVEQMEKRKHEGYLRQLLKSDPTRSDFFSNDYLGLAREKQIAERAHHRLITQDYRLYNGASGSRLLSGHLPIHEELEVSLSTFFQSESCLLFNSGYVANQAVLSSVPQKGDCILYDELSHACIKEGIRLSRADYYSFRHNDLHHLEEKLMKQNKRCFVVVESVYSMDGDITPLNAMAALCQKYGAFLIVDEAHSTGIYGQHGNGMVSQLGLDQQILCKIMTFGKAIGAHGACICGSQVLKDYLVNYARPFIYTTAQAPHALYTIQAAFDYLKDHPELNDLLNQKVTRFVAQLSIKVPKIDTIHPIQSIITGSNTAASRLANKLQNQGLEVRPIYSPTVKKGSERVRICLHTFNTDDDILILANTLNKHFE